MAVITWNDSLALQQPRMDQTHHEFVDLLCEVEAALDGDSVSLLACMAALVDHTDAHFAQEERWMTHCLSLIHISEPAVRRPPAPWPRSG